MTRKRLSLAFNNYQKLIPCLVFMDIGKTIPQLLLPSPLFPFFFPPWLAKFLPLLFELMIFSVTSHFVFLTYIVGIIILIFFKVSISHSLKYCESGWLEMLLFFLNPFSFFEVSPLPMLRHEVFNSIFRLGITRLKLS